MILWPAAIIASFELQEPYSVLIHLTTFTSLTTEDIDKTLSKLNPDHYTSLKKAQLAISNKYPTLNKALEKNCNKPANNPGNEEPTPESIIAKAKRAIEKARKIWF